MKNPEESDPRERGTAGESSAEVMPGKTESRGFRRGRAPWFPGLLLLLAVTLALPNCGGGGGGGSSESGSSAPTSGSRPSTSTGTTQRYNAPFLPSDNFDQVCADPSKASPVDAVGRPYARPAVQGMSVDENNWLRSFFHETYLWSNEIEDRDPACCSTPEYFELMKVKSKDKFSGIAGSTKDFLESQRGVKFGYGFDFYPTDRGLYIRWVEPSSPAGRAGLKRGMLISHIDGRPILSTEDYYAAMGQSSSRSERHEFTVLVPGESSPRSVTMTSSVIQEEPVWYDVLSNSSGYKIGYLFFNSHIPIAEPGLITVMQDFARENVNDLVLDLRYNGGGVITIASRLSYMIAGPRTTANKIFSEDRGNGKLVTGPPTPFLGFDRSGLPLPSLNLNRVFVLTTPDTCSASELIINSLRGIDVEVVLLGGTTCGKPFGFFPKDNCGTTYFVVQLQFLN